MSARTILFHRLAENEYQSAKRWYAKRSERAASRFRLAFHKAIDSIRDHPTQGPAYLEHFRWARLKRFPYVIYYHIADDDRVLIVAVAHGRRRPAYWARRFRPQDS